MIPHVNTGTIGLKSAGWDHTEMAARVNWTLSLTDFAEIERDLEQLESWKRDIENPIAALRTDQPTLPTVARIGARVSAQVHEGCGVTWIHDTPSISPDLLSLLYLAIGLQLGKTIDVYGRLYDVRDSGQSYRDVPIPVSRTRESTGLHTDSSNKGIWPRTIGLACVRPSLAGGASRLISVKRVHARLATHAPDMLKVLHTPFFRDIVTPGSGRSPARVRANAFPIFTTAPQITMRYMRYWIEAGHQRTATPLTDYHRTALDTLDETLTDPSLTLQFALERGDMLFLNNWVIAHGRDAYQENPGAPRHLLRLWLN